MGLPTSRIAGCIVLAALTLPAVVGRDVVIIVDDPHRWARPDVYVCLVAAAYAIGLLVIYAVSPVFRGYVATGLTWWQVVLLNPYVLLMVAAYWVRHHDPVVLILVLALACWLVRRQKVAASKLASPAR